MTRSSYKRKIRKKKSIKSRKNNKKYKNYKNYKKYNFGRDDEEQGVKRSFRSRITAGFKRNWKSIATVGALLGTHLLLRRYNQKYKNITNLPKIPSFTSFFSGKKHVEQVKSEADITYEHTLRPLNQRIENIRSTNGDQSEIDYINLSISKLNADYKNQKSLFTRASNMVTRLQAMSATVDSMYNSNPMFAKVYDTAKTTVIQEATKLITQMNESNEEISELETEYASIDKLREGVQETEDQVEKRKETKEEIKNQIKSAKQRKQELSYLYEELQKATDELSTVKDNSDLELVQDKIKKIEKQNKINNKQNVERKKNKKGTKKNGFGKSYNNKPKRKRKLNGGGKMIKRLKKDLKCLKNC